MVLRDWLSSRVIVRRFGVWPSTIIVMLITMTIVSTVMITAAATSGFPFWPAITVTAFIHLLLLPQTYQTHALIAELDLTRVRLYQQSITDDLTGAFNRRHLIDALKRELAPLAGHERPLTLIQFDLDDFKKINDRYGHDIGDQVLRHVTQICAAHARKTDVFARMGGEEFALLLPMTQLDDAVGLAKRLQEAIAAAPLDVAGETLHFTISAGISTRTSNTTVEDLLRVGDQAMYRAKTAGKNQVAIG